MSEYFQEILKRLRDRGYIEKEEILSAWSLTEDEYTELRKDFAKHKDIEPGPQRIGGFRIKPKRGSLPTPQEYPVMQFASEDWEQIAIRRLCELLQHQELENFLGDLKHTVRLSRKIQTGEDRRGTKEELAHALLLKHGIDLFRNDDIRKVISKKCNVKSPGRWHSGKATAHSFIKATEFPSELAGIPCEDTPEDFEYLEGRVDIKPLQDFQDEVKQKVLNILNISNGRAIVTLPTGAGKTRVAVESIKDWLTSRHNNSKDNKASTVLWLAHSGELCDQAYLEFRQMWQASSAVCPLLLFRFWGRFTQDLIKHREALDDILQRPSILISTPQRIVNLLDDAGTREQEVLKNIQNTTCLIVVDEAHRAAAPSYSRILSNFTEKVPCAVLGLTATPFRTEYLPDTEAGTRELASLFGELIEARSTLGDNPRETLQQRGILARPVVDTIKTFTTLKLPCVQNPEQLSEKEIEQTDHALNLLADDSNRRSIIFQHIHPFCKVPEHSVLYFGPSILDAECMAFLLRQKGIPTAVVSGETRDVTRRRIISEFKSGRLRVLCNCEVLTTGFDAPRITHVVVARPTVSRVLYEQIVGRGLRGRCFGGTDECLIVDCEDNYRSAQAPVLGYQAFRHIWTPKTKI